MHTNRSSSSTGMQCVSGRVANADHTDCDYCPRGQHLIRCVPTDPRGRYHTPCSRFVSCVCTAQGHCRRQQLGRMRVRVHVGHRRPPQRLHHRVWGNQRRQHLHVMLAGMVPQRRGQHGMHRVSRRQVHRQCVPERHHDVPGVCGGEVRAHRGRHHRKRLHRLPAGALVRRRYVGAVVVLPSPPLFFLCRLWWSSSHPVP